MRIIFFYLFLTLCTTIPFYFKQRSPQFRVYPVFLIFAFITLLFSVFQHFSTVHYVGTDKVELMVTDRGFEQLYGNFAWSIFRRGVLYGNVDITPLIELDSGNYLKSARKGIIAFIDVSNPPPFLIIIWFLIFARTSYKRFDFFIAMESRLEDNKSTYTPEDPNVIWKCPACNKENPNISFKCISCNYSLK